MPPYTIIYFPVRGHSPQVPGRRPHPIPVQCHPVTPGPLPRALWEGPAGGGLAGCREQWCGGSPLQIRPPHLH
uniref:Uncharacterized protein n=3 Tax=Canis lupus TaxID=9612 RepID=A0A8C0S192_CANLF